ncbi:hypothetical protein J4477_02000 [Candidatus Pacearchaeota archaeon]|nr:hypothetical protein [Candidatus Pacearchaeota archaeon]
MVKKRVRKAVKKSLRKTSLKKDSILSRKFDNIPLSIKIISILFYVAGALALAFGIFFIISVFMIPNLVRSLGTPEEIIQIITESNPGVQITVDDLSNLISILPVLFAGAGIVLIALGILYIFIGRGLISRKQWAKVLAVLFVALGIVQSVISLFGGRIVSGIVWLAIFITIEYYLAFDEQSKKFFR